MSTHAVRVIEIAEVRPHQNAERLEIVPIGGWQAVTRKGQFKPGDRAIYVEPDYVVPTTAPEFAFLAREGKADHRLKAVKLRGVISFGLLIEVPDRLAGKAVGDDVMADLGVSRYVPPARPFRGGSDDHELPFDDRPQVIDSKFDIESLSNYGDLFMPGEPVHVTEKIDGGNARFVHVGGTLYMGSRSRWLRPDKDHFWSRACAASPGVADWCRANEGKVLYGEVYGPVQSLKYGLSEPRFIAFAARAQNGNWCNWSALRSSLMECGVPAVPDLYEGPFDIEAIKALAEQDSRVGPPGHMMEGVVIVPMTERQDERVGRVALKHISQRFWLSDN